MNGQGGSLQPGWYPDPQTPGQQRWWDGNGWTEHTSAMAGAGGQMAYGGEKVDTWLWQSIVATLLCCLPLGIVAIVFASQAQSAMNAGNMGEAQAKAKQAKTFTLVSVGLGVAVLIAYVLFFVVLGVGMAGMGL